MTSDAAAEMTAARTLFLTQAAEIEDTVDGSVVAGMPPAIFDRASPSNGVLPAVGGEGRPGDEPGIVGGEEDDAARNLLGLAEAAERDLRQDVLLQHVLGHRLDHL